METKPRFHARELMSLTASVQREIERMILDGEVAAGDRLSESALAQAMGVSRGPVREAMRGLAQQGLVEVIANRGVVVRSVDVTEALQLYDLRGAIFGLACQSLADVADTTVLSELRAFHDEFARAIGAGDREAYYAANIRFHRCIVDGCGNPPARDAYERVVQSMHLFRRRGLSHMVNMQASLGEHEAIVEAVAAGDGEAAGAAGRAHVQNGKLRFLRSLQTATGDAASDPPPPRRLWA